MGARSASVAERGKVRAAGGGEGSVREHKGKPAVYVPDRKSWRAWLERNGKTSMGVWLVFYKKASGKSRVSYDEAVEEALCFGWIDAVVNAVDDECFVQWFAPRKPKGTWSALNKKRVAELTAKGLMRPEGQVHIDAAQADGRWEGLDAHERLEVPDDLAAALKREKARATWDGFSPSSRKGILTWIGMAKKADTRAARVEKTASMAARGLRAQFDKE